MKFFINFIITFKVFLMKLFEEILSMKKSSGNYFNYEYITAK